MTPEEYQRIKEAEKEHLRALKKLKAQLREVERKKSVAQALENMTKAPGDDVLRTHEEMIDRLAMDTIQQEARLEVALSDADSTGSSAEEVSTGSSAEEVGEGSSAEEVGEGSSDTEAASDDAETAPGSTSSPSADAELQKVRAQDLVRQIKIQMGLPTDRRKQETPENVTDTDSAEMGAPQGKEPDSGTLATPVRPNQSTSESLPEKTIGRIPRKKP